MKAVLFDLDGTLLPMDQELFTKTYFKELCKKMAPHGFEPGPLIDAVWGGTYAMVANDGTRTNEEVFWDYMASVFGEEARDIKPDVNYFYANEFSLARPVCGFAPQAGPLVKELKKRGVRVILASNPIFPMPGQINRLSWTGADPEDFEFITSYETSHYAKPNPKFFSELCERLELDPADCLMVGNDASEDTPALSIGMQVFLITDCLLNPNNADISNIPHGDFDKAVSYILSLL